jgi:type I restriction enzyme S subunit
MPAGSVLMSSRAPIGYLAIAAEDCCTNQGCKSIVSDNGYGSSFIYFSLKHFMPLIESQGAGTTFKEVSGSVLGSVRLPLPSQYQTFAFEESVKPLMDKEKETEREVNSLTSLRDWLLPMLMNGQARVV